MLLTCNIAMVEQLKMVQGNYFLIGDTRISSFEDMMVVCGVWLCGVCLCGNALAGGESVV